MFPDGPTIPAIPLHERTPAVASLLAIITHQQEQIAVLNEQVQLLKDEIARLKGHKPKPTIRPSALDQQLNTSNDGKRPGSAKRSKTAELEIHKTIKVPPKDKLPEGSRFRGYDDFTVVGLRFEAENIRYRLEVWETPDGRRVKGDLPEHLQALGGHFSPVLVSYIQHQYHHGGVPQHLIVEELHDFGVEISEGQVNRILVDGKERFHEEKASLLPVGLEVSSYIHVDDTGARHQGRNGYCTHIGNAYFAYFVSTESKSRVNFLGILRAGHTDYVVDSYAVEYMRNQKLPPKVVRVLEGVGNVTVANEEAWVTQLREWGIVKARHVRIVTEGALLASVLSHGMNPNLAVMSDDAGQFNVLLHALCWVHAERTLAKLIGFNEEQRTALETKRTQVWDLYRLLKVYKEKPTENLKKEIGERFDVIFQEKTCFATLNHALGRLHGNKAELLLVVERPDIPLHNNLSENDIREYVTRRKRSGSTRSDLGRLCRDTFASLKKTCRKLGISFWRYLVDRNAGANTIRPLSELMRQRAQEAQA